MKNGQIRSKVHEKMFLPLSWSFLVMFNVRDDLVKVWPNLRAQFSCLDDNQFAGSSIQEVWSLNIVWLISKGEDIGAFWHKYQGLQEAYLARAICLEKET